MLRFLRTDLIQWIYRQILHCLSLLVCSLLSRDVDGKLPAIRGVLDQALIFRFIGHFLFRLVLVFKLLLALGVTPVFADYIASPKCFFRASRAIISGLDPSVKGTSFATI